MNFRELEISDFRGIASSNRHPQKNECQECKNFDTRYIDGDLTLRAGFSQRYAAPANADHRTKLSNITYLGFQNFIPEGTTQEVTIWVAKATLAGETGIANGTPANRNILAIFSSHQFNGTSWEDLNYDGVTTGKYWLNQTIVTSLQTNSTDNECELDFNGNTVLTGSIDPAASVNVVGVGTLFTTELVVGDRILVSGEVRVVATITDATHLTVTAAFTDNANDTSPEKLLNLDGWTIINIGPEGSLKNPYEVAQVIETYIHNGQYTGVKITNDAHSWDSGAPDQIVLMKNYVPYDSLIAMYSCVANDITFHKVLNDLRIGFGGQENRIGLSIGYRNKAFLIGDIAFPTFTADQVDQLATVNNLVLDTYNGYGIDARFSLQALSGGSLPADTYTFQMVGYLDDFNSFLMAKDSIEISTGNDLIVTPLIKWGNHNKRLTKIEIYYADSTGAYLKFKTYELSSTLVDGNSWEIDTNGDLRPSLTSSTDLYLTSDALSSTSEINSVTTWETQGACTITSESATPAAYNGTYYMEILSLSSTRLYVGARYKTAFTKGTKYLFDFYVYVTNACTLRLGGTLTDSGSVPSWDITTTSAWVRLQAYVTVDPSVTSTGKISILSELSTSDYLAVDNFRVYQYTILANFTSDELAVGQEISDAMGYLPTFDMVKSWDQAIVTSGRTFYVNPYIEKRYENKIFRSHISGAGAFMYDAVSAGEYIDLENFDGNSLVGIEVLPNLDFIALKTNGSQRVDPNTGATREISFSSGCNSRRSIVNFGDKVCWTSDHDIHASDGLNVISIADKSIREEYRTLVGGLSGNKIFATRETKDNSYRFLMNAPALEKEYILTKKGWIVRQNANSLVPDFYSTSQDGTVWFMDSGIIYWDATGVSLDNVTTLSASWKSVEIDAELIGESLTARDFIAINEVWADFTIIDNLLLDSTISVKLYLDGTLYKTFTHAATHAGGHGRKKLFSPMTTMNCRRFSIEVTVTGAGVLGTLVKLHSVGVMLKPIPAGHFN